MDPVTLQAVWKAHTDSEFISKDVEATLETMTEDAFVLNVPTGVGAVGKDKVRGFYKDIFIGTLPDDWDGELKHRVVGESALVDEIRQTFTHTRQMDWILPGIRPTGRKIEVGIVAVVLFRDDKICGERIYWDHASVLQQASLL
jgi:carboxymethylenebutenolidase